MTSPPKNGERKTFAYETIKDNIINCVYSPGAILSEQNLSDELQISRTPIREALNRIQSEGFVRVLPKKGVMVAEIAISDVNQIFQVREELEPIIIKNAGPYLEQAMLLKYKYMIEHSQDVKSESGGIFATKYVKTVTADMDMHKYFADSCRNKFIIELMQKVFEHNKRIVIATNQDSRVHDATLEHMAILDLLLEKNFEAASDTMRKHIVSCKEAAFKYFMSWSGNFSSH